MSIYATLRGLLRLGARRDHSGKPRVDPSRGDELAARLRAELAEGSWAGTAEFLESPEASANWDDRAFYAEAIADWPERPEWLDAWASANPESSAARLVRGVHSLRWAWDARGRGLASTVSQRKADLFFERLEKADADLYAAANLAPEDPTPWAFMIPVAMGLNMELEEQARRFEAAVQRHPLHLLAHSLMLNSLSEKWFGSRDKMFEFARHSAKKAPEGCGLKTLIPQAHVERWLYYLIEGDDAGAERYFFQSVSDDEIRAAAEESVFSPEYRETKRANWERGYFAFCFWMMGETTLASQLFEAIGPWVEELPWGYLDDPAKEFAKARRECLKAMAKADGAKRKAEG